MLVENQLVETKWTSNNIKYYEQFGYRYTKTLDPLIVKPEHLPKTSMVRVNVICDIDGCDNQVNIPYSNYRKSIEKHGIYICSKCANRIRKDKERISNIPKRYKMFIDWCNNNNYVPLSKEEDCQSYKSILYYECHKHGIGHIKPTQIQGGTNIGFCCKKETTKYNSHTPEEVTNIIESKNNNMLLNAEEYIDMNTKNLRVVCGTCKKEFITSLASVVNGDGHCYECGFKKSQNERKKAFAKVKYKKYLDKCNKMGYIPTLLEDDFLNIMSNDNISFICKKHGFIEQSYNHFANDENTACTKCGNEKNGDMFRLPIEIVTSIIESKNKNKLLNPEDYTRNTVRNLKVLCGNCNKIFKTSLAIYDRNLTGKCPHCNEKSYGEYIILLILDKYKINHTRQEHFDGDCRDIYPLPFDFYLPDYNMCIEFDGQGHFKPIWGDESFLNTLLHDGMKNNYCRWNNIKLLRIPYWKGNNIEDILIEELNLGIKRADEFKQMIYKPKSQQTQQKIA